MYHNHTVVPMYRIHSGVEILLGKEGSKDFSAAFIPYSTISSIHNYDPLKS